MVEEADVQDTMKLFDVISVTDSEVSTTAGGRVVSPSDVSTWEKKANNVPMKNIFTFVALGECIRWGLLTGTVGRGEIEACDLAASVVQDADQLTLVGDAWTQPADGVGVEVSGDGDLPPARAVIFLPERIKRWKVNGLQATVSKHEADIFSTAVFKLKGGIWTSVVEQTWTRII